MKILIIDDHPVFREGLAVLLQQLGPETTIVEAANASQAFKLLAEHADCDIVILDLLLPEIDGSEALLRFGKMRPDVPVIVLSSSEDHRDAQKALARGALGYVPKSASRHTLLSAIKLVMNGQLYLPPLILSGLAAPSTEPVHGRPVVDQAALTRRQTDVLRLLADGQSNKAIGLKLGLSEKTVKAHVTAIFKTLKVFSRVQAVAAGRQSGLL
jgi:two-component system, NarL family, nitrate/nitrite response regulator NarL